MTPFYWQRWRIAWGRGNRGGEITFGSGTDAVRWRYVAMGFWWRLGKGGAR